MTRSLIAAASIMAATTAQAENFSTLYEGGASGVYHWARNSGGYPMCVMSTTWGKRNCQSHFNVKHTAKVGYWVEFRKDTWKFKPDARVKIQLMLDSEGWDIEAVGQRNSQQAIGALLRIKKAE